MDRFSLAEDEGEEAAPAIVLDDEPVDEEEGADSKKKAVKAVKGKRRKKVGGGKRANKTQSPDPETTLDALHRFQHARKTDNSSASAK